MAEKMSGLSLDLIIHPGETIKEILEEKGMNQEELAIRTGFSSKHISEVINGKKGISPSFAKSLGYALGMPTSFWINLQGIYDKEMLDYKEQNEIDEREISIVKSLKDLIKYAEDMGIMTKNTSTISKIIELRNICNVSNLSYINRLVKKQQINENNNYIVYVGGKISELVTKKC